MSATKLTARQYALAAEMDEAVRERQAVRKALTHMMIHVLPLGTDEESTIRWIDEHYPAPRITVLDELLRPEPFHD